MFWPEFRAEQRLSIILAQKSVKVKNFLDVERKFSGVFADTIQNGKSCPYFKKGQAPIREWMNQGVKDMGLNLSFAFSGAKDR